MHCQTCGYALWNLTEPRCPECGTGFDLRVYRFKPGAVAFACPHCGALHEGAGEQYLPARSDEATCHGCGQTMCVTHMRVVPLVDDPDAAQAAAMPWDDRKRLGFWRAWWRTFLMSLSAPTTLVRQTLPGSSFGNSYRFALACHAFGLLGNIVTIGLGFGLLYFMAVQLGSGSGGGLPPYVFLMMVGIMVAYLLVAAVLTPLLVTVFVGGPAHLFLWVFEPGRKGFAVTARTVNYAQGPMTFAIVPIVGLYCGSVWYVWTLVNSVLMLKEAHRTTGLKASLAVLWLPVLMMGAYFAVMIGVPLAQEMGWI